MTRSFKISASVLAIALGSATFNGPAFAQEAVGDNQALPGSNSATSADQGAIIVSGVRQSIESAIDDKQRATEIKDSITAEDIGQLANDNVSEALQRITGVQVSRSDDGEGQSVQIRGLSENNIELNGEIVSGSGGDRGITFQDVPAELFSGVEVQKAATADAIEGTLGGTINLKTRAPLSGRKSTIFNVTGTSKYQEQGKIFNQDASGLFIHQFRDTPIGDFGILLNAGYKHTETIAEVYGGGDYEAAPATWVRRDGSQGCVAPFTSGPYACTTSLDVNGSGASNAQDIYYIPNNFGYFLRHRDEKRRSFNGTLEWKPADNLDIRFDTTLTDVNEALTGSRYSINFQPARSAPLIGGPGNVFTELGTTPNFGPVYYMEAGRIGAATTRIGAAPSQNEIKRKSQDYSLELNWQATDRLNLYVKGTTSRGTANTIVQGQLNTGADYDGNGQLNAADFAGIVDFDLSGGPIPMATLYESPFPSKYNGNKLQTTLNPQDPSNINYARQSYFQFQRNAQDTLSKNKSLRFDATYDMDGSPFLKAFKFGMRYAERSYFRQSFQNANQNVGPSILAAPGSAPVLQINVQRIPVNPGATTNAGYAAASTFLQQCLTTAGLGGALSGYGGNLPTTWGDTSGCPINAIGTAFNMIDIRAINPATGAGYYEQTELHYDVTEKTTAAYLRADFQSNLTDGILLYGNAGVRYIKTRTTSSGFARNKAGSYDFVTFPASYDDWLPSLNLNFGLSKQLILRLAYSRSLGRPGLDQISPGLTLFYNTDNPGYDGSGTAGNPNLKPVHSDNLDASLEWYYAKGSFISVAAFQKKIDTTIFLSSDQVPFQIGDQLFLVQTYGNFGGTRIRGVEVGMAHAFRYLPGPLKHTGVTANYTYISEQSDLLDQEGDPISRRGLSRQTLNLGAYYDDGVFSTRVAYNWRSAFTRRENVALGFGSSLTLPEIEAARGQLDLAMRLKVTRNLTFTFNAINLTNTGTYRYMKYYPLTNYIAEAGRKYNLGVSLNF